METSLAFNFRIRAFSSSFQSTLPGKRRVRRAGSSFDMLYNPYAISTGLIFAHWLAYANQCGFKNRLPRLALQGIIALIWHSQKRLTPRCKKNTIWLYHRKWTGGTIHETDDRAALPRRTAGGRLVYPDGICRKNGKGDASDCGIATSI